MFIPEYTEAEKMRKMSKSVGATAYLLTELREGPIMYNTANNNVARHSG